MLFTAESGFPPSPAGRAVVNRFCLIWPTPPRNESRLLSRPLNPAIRSFTDLWRRGSGVLNSLRSLLWMKASARLSRANQSSSEEVGSLLEVGESGEIGSKGDGAGGKVQSELRIGRSNNPEQVQTCEGQRQSD